MTMTFHVVEHFLDTDHVNNWLFNSYDEAKEWILRNEEYGWIHTGGAVWRSADGNIRIHVEVHNDL